MDKRTKKLHEYFPEATTDTKLALLGPSQKIVIGKTPLQLNEYDIGDGRTMYAAYSVDTDTIYLRLVDSAFFSVSARRS